ncbi:unnamed protein product [Parascedosporium putredinis]|uniref:Uncharacterized protein n=1 Tax=Parascedosporium putredinis TaxID=1442378 RepID=A0A9P1H984_9PEZI|nr:unnamed protein product [Parascedosporium putredinis]CAI8001551.1 unnamed protein product [Parascedosporium putredinis]
MDGSRATWHTEPAMPKAARCVRTNYYAKGPGRSGPTQTSFTGVHHFSIKFETIKAQWNVITLLPSPHVSCQPRHTEDQQIKDDLLKAPITFHGSSAKIPSRR